MDNQPISISEALNHVQSWLNAKEYEKAIQGCAEILEIEPANQRALALMKLAEENRHGENGNKSETQTEPTEPEVTHEPDRVTPTFDPLANLQTEARPEGETRFGTRPSIDHESQSSFMPTQRRMFLAMLVPAILVVLLGGGTIWLLSAKDREEVIEAAITNLPSDTSYLQENETRVKDLTEMSAILEKYKIEKGKYPSADELEKVLVTSGEYKKAPADPRTSEIDKAGKEFGYVYAVYDGMGGEQSVYVLSALFEDSKGFAYPWTTGAPIRNYANYRNVDESNITFIGGVAN